MHLTQVAEINPNERTGAVLTNLAKISNGLYNTALYANTQKYNSEKKFIFYEEMCDALKDDELYGLLASQSAQAVLQKVDGGIKSFLKLHKKGYKDAQFPHFHRKDTEWILPYKSQQIKIAGNKITLPMSLGYRKQAGLSYISFGVPNLRYEGELKYLELFKFEGRWRVCMVFDVKNAKKMDIPKKDNFYIDLGIRNAATIWDGEKTTIYSGGKIRSTIQYKDKKVAEVHEVLAIQGRKTSKEKRMLARQAMLKTKQRIHAMTTQIVETARSQGKGVVIGKLVGIRQNMNFGHMNNQQVHQWAFNEVAKELEYKCKLNGVRFRAVSERETSKTCALCGKEERGRIHRGLYRCKLYNVVFNADCNGALNIEKRYLRMSLHKGSGIGVVAALAQPAVLHWNEHMWRDELKSARVGNAVSS